VNACSLSRFCEGAVLNPKDAAPRVAPVVKAARLFGLLTVWGPRKVRPLAAKQGRSLFGFRLFRRNATQPSLPKLLSGLWRANVLAVSSKHVCVSIAQVLFRRQALQVFCSVIRLNAVDVVNLFGGVKRLQPTGRNNAMHEVVPSTERQVPIFSQSGRVRLELSESFSAARNGVKVVEESVLDSVYFYAQHAVPLRVTKESAF